jgi:hypothetical protein
MRNSAKINVKGDFCRAKRFVAGVFGFVEITRAKDANEKSILSDN